ncbi:hypothetical protein Hanom_Chr17g01578711 [Helianthus anomalus]
MKKTIAAWSFLFRFFCDLGEDDLQRAFFILAHWAFPRIPSLVCSSNSTVGLSRLLHLKLDRKTLGNTLV